MWWLCSHRSLVKIHTPIQQTTLISSVYFIFHPSHSITNSSSRNYFYCLWYNKACGKTKTWQILAAILFWWHCVSVVPTYSVLTALWLKLFVSALLFLSTNRHSKRYHNGIVWNFFNVQSKRGFTLTLNFSEHLI